MDDRNHDDTRQRIVAINGKPFSQNIALKGMDYIEQELKKDGLT